MDRLRALTRDVIPEPVRAFRAEGGRVVGYSCLTTPVEILDAAGLLPLRLRALGRAETDLADARLSRFNCSFCRALLQLGLDGTYDVLDGLIASNGCDQLRGMYENWQYAHESAFFHYLKVPHIHTADAREYLELELRRYRDAVAAFAGVTLGDEELAEALARQVRIRALLRKLSALREQDPPRLSGTEALIAVCAEGCLRPADYEALLRQELRDLATRPPLPRPRARLLLGGAATDEIDLLADIEGLGGLVVADTMCFGARAFWRHPEDGEDRDPIAVLAEQLLTSSLCPRMIEQFDDRLAFVQDSVQRAQADGVLLVHNKFCDVHGIDNALLRLTLEERGVPVLALEKEYGALGDRARIRTRVQALLERIGGPR